MNRLTAGIILSFTVILSITALNYTPSPVSAESSCKVSSGCNHAALLYGNQSSCNKESLDKGCAKSTSCNSKNKGCGVQCTKPCCAKKISKTCSPNCSKPCCAMKDGI